MKNQNDGLLFQERRAFRRVPVNIDARFTYSNMFYAGMIANLSETGMFINTRQSLPIGTHIVVMIRDGSELTKVFVEIQRVENSHKYSDGIGVKLVSPSKDYLGLVKDLKTTY